MPQSCWRRLPGLSPRTFSVWWMAGWTEQPQLHHHHPATPKGGKGVDRFGTTLRETYGILGKKDAFQLKVSAGNLSKPFYLTSLGLFGTIQEEKSEVGVSVLQDKTVLTHLTTKWECDGTMAPHMVKFLHGNHSQDRGECLHLSGPWRICPGRAQ